METDPVVAAWATLGTAFIIISIGIGMCLILLRAANTAPASMITLSLSVLTLVALGGSLVVEAPEPLVTLAGVGLGALASSLTSLFNPPLPVPVEPFDGPDDMGEKPKKSEGD